MNEFIEALVNKYNLQFQEDLQEEKQFFSKPLSLSALLLSSLTLIEKLVPIQKTSQEINNFLKKDKNSNTIINYASTQSTTDGLNNLLNACLNNKSSIPLASIKTGNFLSLASQINDIDSAINLNELNKITLEVQNYGAKLLSYTYLLYHIIDLVKELFSTELPSLHRTQYVQRLLRYCYGFLKNENQSTKEFTNLLNSFEQIDNVLLAIAIATGIYLGNRLKIFNNSKNSLASIASDTICENIQEPFDISVNILPLPTTLNCPVNNDDDLVPHMPIELKTALTCAVVQNSETSTNISTSQDIATYAVIQNDTSQAFISFVGIGSYVTPDTKIANLGSTVLYAPINGFVDNVQKNEIVLRDISEPVDDPISSKTTLLQQQYQELNDTKAFLKNYFVDFLYPPMLAIATEDDSSTANINVGVKIQYDSIVKNFNTLDTNYNNDVQTISGKDNVEKNAKNENLSAIKDQLDNTQNLYYSNLNSLGQTAYDIAAITAALPSEYDLLSYYKEYQKTLAAIKNPTSLEITFTTMISNFISQRKGKIDLKTQTIIEGNTIKNFMDNLWIQLNSLPASIEQTQNELNSLAEFSYYTIIPWNGTYEARLYKFSEKNNCKNKETNDYLNPESKYGFGDIEYWLKYCAYATLVSVANPVTGWSTGWIVPNPILFPVVYIPLKSINTKYGFIVIGISICGVYIFPWTLFVNYSSLYAVPIGDPTTSLKAEINALKKAIGDSLNSLKQNLIKPQLNKINEQINDINEELTNDTNQLQKNKENKPKKYSSPDIQMLKGIQQNLNYDKQYAQWTQLNLELQNQILSLNTKKWELTKLYAILYEAYNSGSSVAGTIKSLEDTENEINNKLDELSSLADKIDLTLAAFPIHLVPETANFGLTLKNPTPIINIDTHINDNINNSELDKFLNKFKLNNEDLMRGDYNTSSIFDFNAYKTALLLAMPLLIKKDPFPKYELLSLANLPWLTFLLKNFTTTGAKTFGFPGYPPI